MKKKILAKRMIASILSTMMIISMVMTGIPFGNLQARADDEATVSKVWATFGDEGPSDFEITEAPEDSTKKLWGLLISGGLHTITADEIGFPIVVNNSHVTYSNASDAPKIYDIYLFGTNSSVTIPGYTVSGSLGTLPDDWLSKLTSNDELFNMFGKYDFTFTGYTDWSNWFEMKTITVNEGVTLRLIDGQDEGRVICSGVVAKNATINGIVSIANSGASSYDEMLGENIINPNTFAIDGGGSLTIGENGQIVGEGNAWLEIRESATVSGNFDAYEYNDSSEPQLTEHTFSEGHDLEGFYVGDENRWILASEGGGEGEPSKVNEFRFIKIGDGDITVTIGEETLDWDDDSLRPFTKDETISFRVNGDVYKLFVPTNDGDVNLSSTDGNYTYEPTDDNYFEIVIYTSQETYEYDYCQPGEGQFKAEYNVLHDDPYKTNDNNKIEDNSTSLGDDLIATKFVGSMAGGWKKYILNGESATLELTIVPCEGYDYKIVMKNFDDDVQNGDVTQDVKDHNNIFTWDVNKATDMIYPQICFFAIDDTPSTGGDDDPGSGQHNNPDEHDSEMLKTYIEEKMYAYGDWTVDSFVTKDDILMGMACEIYYPMFSDSPYSERLRTKYSVSSVDDLKAKITVGDIDATRALPVTDINGNVLSLPAYPYTVTLTNEDDPTDIVEASGIAYAFDFTSEDSNYYKNNRGCIVAVTKKGDDKNYFLRVVNAYAGGTKPDTQKINSSELDGEESIVVIADFDNKDSVSIFGNGASLDKNALLSEEADTSMAVYQGRNESLMQAIGKASGWGCIFSSFAFYKPDFEGVMVQGSGASGNTPSWAFNQHKVFSTSDNESTENEAIVFFGNTDVSICPVTISGFDTTVTGIESIEAVGDIPSSAITISEPDTDGNITVSFKSDFYDKVKLKITSKIKQEGGENTTDESYIVIHRVGIDILSGGLGKDDDDDTTYLFHGTEKGPEYTPDDDSDFFVWGTYYYPNSGDEKVDLYVTYTYSDGSTKEEIVPNDPSLNIDAPTGGNCKSSDFILYKGHKYDAPKTIEAIAVQQGYDNDTTFSGAKFGAGKGVAWTKKD